MTVSEGKEGLEAQESAFAFLPSGRRHFGRFNLLGVWTLYKKEVLRFTSVWLQTIMAPMITTLLFYTIFSLAFGSLRPSVNGIDYVRFLAPGLIMMSVLQNAFANTSSSVLISKIQGNIVDSLMPPLSAGELTFAYAMGGMTRGLAVAVATAIPLSFLVDLSIENFAALVFFAASGALMLSLIGVIGGIWADKFDHMAAVTNFIIMPLAFLSGTFYSIERLPESFQAFSQFNPFFYTIDGFRAGFIGQGDTNLLTGVIVMCVINLVLWAVCHRMFAVGWRLKP